MLDLLSSPDSRMLGATPLPLPLPTTATAAAATIAVLLVTRSALPRAPTNCLILLLVKLVLHYDTELAPDQYIHLCSSSAQQQCSD